MSKVKLRRLQRLAQRRRQEQPVVKLSNTIPELLAEPDDARYGRRELLEKKTATA
jgi:hypothetical protein